LMVIAQVATPHNSLEVRSRMSYPLQYKFCLL
jgi:hypothetical protein